MKSIFRIIPIILIGLLVFQCARMKPVVSPPVQSEKKTEYQLTDKIPFDDQIQAGKLANGLQYYIRKNIKPENRAELRLVVNAGSVLEDDDQQGLAHVVEHMAFNGTKHFEKHQIIDFLESIGMRFGPEINAYTSFDETVYMLEVPTDSAEIMETAFQILQDWAQGLAFDPEEVDKERGVIIEEWRLGRGADARMRDQQFPIMFKGSKYADRLPIGKKTVLDSFKHETLIRFYEDWYRPELMAVVAVGDFDVEEMEDKIHHYFSPLQNSEDARPRKFFTVPDHQETLFAIATDPEASQTSFSVYYKKPVQKMKNISGYRQMIIKNLYDGILNQRLKELTKEADPPYLYAYGGTSRFVRTKNSYVLGAGVKEGGILRALETVLTEAARVRQHGFTQGELQRIKKNTLRRMETYFLEKDKTYSRNYASEYIRHYLHDEPVPGIEKEYELFQQFVPTITLEEINARARETIIDSNRVVVIDAPEKDWHLIPSQEIMLNLLNTIDSLKVDPYEESVSDAPLVENPPEPGAIVSTKRFDPIDVTEWTLSNGLRVVIKSTDFKNDEIGFTSYSFGGHSLLPDSLYVSAVTTTSIINESGLGDFDAIELSKKLAGQKVRVAPYLGELREGFSGSSSPQDLETLFQLVYLYFTEPRADSTAFQSYQTRMKGYIENRSVRPETAYSDTISVTLSQYHHRARPWSEALLDEMDLGTSLNIYQDRFQDASDFTFLFVGNIDTVQFKPLVLTYLGGLPSANRKETFHDLEMNPPEGPLQKSVYKGLEPKSRVSLYIKGDAEYSRKERYLFQSMISALQIKFREVLREDKSGTYGVSLGGSISKYPDPSYSIRIAFGCDPERVDELTQLIHTQIDSMAEFGIDSSYVQKVRETQLRGYEVGLKENGTWLNTLLYLYMHDRHPEQILSYPDMVKAMRREDLHQMVQKYFKMDKALKFVLFPESNEEVMNPAE